MRAKKLYDVRVTFSVWAENGGDAAYETHKFIPDVEGAVESWVIYDSSTHAKEIEK